MNTKTRRLAINVGGGFVPGMNSVVMGTTLSAARLGWEVVGIKDGFDGLLYPERYSDGGMVTLKPEYVENLDPTAGSILGQSPRVDPFNVRKVNKDNLVEEVDRSDHIIDVLKAEGIDGLISVVSGQGLSVFYKLHLKGLNTVCIPRSTENDIAGTKVSFGFAGALSFTIEMLGRARQAARSARRISVVEVQGEQAGWLALQAGIAVCADAVLIPEIPCDLDMVAATLRDKVTLKRPYGLVVVAEGTQFVDKAQAQPDKPPAHSLKNTLSPLATGDEGAHVIRRSGQAAETVVHRIQLLTAEETHPVVLGPWAGSPSAVDQQLGLAYGAGAVQALKAGENGVMVGFQQLAATLAVVPLAEAINKIRTVQADSSFIEIAQSLGICLGGEL